MITIILHKSIGNESVGEMWHEILTFPEETTLKELLDKIDHKGDIIIPSMKNQSLKGEPK